MRLETIVEDTSNVWSTTSNSNMASQGSHHSQNAGRTAIKYNMTLEYHMDNIHGAKIYVDPLGRYAVRIDDHKIEFIEEFPVSIQGDHYMDLHATKYLIVEDPQVYNHWGVRVRINKGKSPMSDIEGPPLVDDNLLCQVNSILLQQMQVDDPTMGLYYLELDPEPTLFLEARGADPTTYTDKKVMYVFLKKDLISDSEVVYLDRFNNEHIKVPTKEVVSTYYFGGLPLLEAFGGAQKLVPDASVHSHPRNQGNTYKENFKAISTGV